MLSLVRVMIDDVFSLLLTVAFLEALLLLFTIILVAHYDLLIPVNTWSTLTACGVNQVLILTWLPVLMHDRVKILLSVSFREHALEIRLLVLLLQPLTALLSKLRAFLINLGLVVAVTIEQGRINLRINYRFD